MTSHKKCAGPGFQQSTGRMLLINSLQLNAGWVAGFGGYHGFNSQAIPFDNF